MPQNLEHAQKLVPSHDLTRPFFFICLKQRNGCLITTYVKFHTIRPAVQWPFKEKEG